MAIANVLLPVFLIAGAGYLVGWLTRPDTQSVTKVVFYVLGPALIFHSLYTGSVSGSEISTTILFVAIFHLGLLGLSFFCGRLLHWDEDTRAAAILSFSFNNAGNYGLPILLFAFGEEGFALGVIYMLSQVTLHATLGIGIASWKRGMATLDFFLNVAKVPWVYALVLALILRAATIDLPTGVARPIELLAQAAIPVQLLLLGIQLSRVRFGRVIRLAGWITAAKLVLPPLLAWGLTGALGVEGLLRVVLTIEASTPTAINALILSLQYKRSPDLVASVVLLTTVGSLGTIGLLLILLG